MIMATFLIFFLPVLIVVGYFFTNKWHKFEDKYLKVIYNVILALLALGWISLVVTALVK